MTAGPATQARGASTPADGVSAAGSTGADSGTGAGRHSSRKARQAGTRHHARLSISNWPVSTRLIGVFAVASVTGLVFGGMRVTDAIANSNAYARTAQLAVLGQQVTQLTHNLENERDLTVGVAAISGLQQDAVAANAGSSVTTSLRQSLASVQQRLTVAQRATDAVAAPVQQLARNVVSNSSFPATIQDAANAVVTQATSLNALRLETLNQSPALIIADFSGSLSALFTLNDELASSAGDPVLANEVRALGGLSRAKDEASQQRAILYAGFLESGLNDAGGKPTSGNPTGAAFNNFRGAVALTYAGGLQALNTAQNIQITDLQTFQSAATPDDYQAYVTAVTGPQVASAQTINQTVTAANGDTRAIFPQITQFSPGFTSATAPDLWFTDQTAVVNSMRAVEDRLVTQIVARSQVLQHQAFESGLVTSVVTMAALLFVLVATALVGRTLVNPLRRLQEDALEIAAVRLPARVAAAAAGDENAEGSAGVEPIGVWSTDEIGRVARAFDQVHSEAVRLAGTEAQLRSSLNAMFISLSRRSVPLIERLARMIDTMEQNEDDSDQLAKLFSMDHLVTRMRRNSENLLVLAGEEPVRKWTEAVPLSDIVRAAASEIEQYNRVALAVQPGITISGQAAADVVHLLAELIENATLFSPQHAQVNVSVAELGTGGVLVEVRDEGVGISANRLADMNWRLDHPPMVDVSISRHMGLYAVSRLAARHGIRVKLRPGASQGLSALVWLPGTLARREAAPTTGFSLTSAADVTGPATGTMPSIPGRPGSSGRHRSGALAAKDSGPQPVVPEPRAAQSGTAWFTAKRPSNGVATPPEELAASWQPPASGMAPPEGPGLLEQAERTSSGLPRRVPRSNAYPGSDVRDSRKPAAASADPEGTGTSILSAPPGAVVAQDIPQQEAPYQEQLPTRRRSADAVRSRLTGFQLGSRDAVQEGRATGSAPLAGEENSR